MMKENNSMLAHFQKPCKTLDWNSLNLSLCKRITWFRSAFEARISQKISCYLESENMDALFSMCYSALQHWYFGICRIFPAQIRVSGQPKYTWSTTRAEIAPPRWPDPSPARIGVSGPPKFVFPDCLVTLDRLTGPKSLLRASMSSDNWIPLERAQHEINIVITSGNSRGFLSVANSTNCIVCTIG